MSKLCISNCVDDVIVPVRATYVNLYKWPESDAEFMKSAAVHGGARPRSTVVDSVSCRQMYLRSYTFSRKETVPEKTVKCFGKVKERVAAGKKEVRRRRRRVWVMWRVKKRFPCAALCSFFRRLLLCAASVDVVDRRV